MSLQYHKKCREDAAIKLQKLIYKNTGTIVPRDAAHEVVDAITLSVIKSIEHFRASRVGENGVKPDTWYALNDAGEFLEVA